MVFEITLLLPGILVAISTFVYQLLLGVLREIILCLTYPSSRVFGLRDANTVGSELSRLAKRYCLIVL